MKREDAEKMADDIFDMIDSNHPRGLVKSELVDLLCKYDTGHRDIKRDVTETGETAMEQIQRLYNTRGHSDWKKYLEDVAIYGSGVYVAEETKLDPQDVSFTVKSDVSPYQSWLAWVEAGAGKKEAASFVIDEEIEKAKEQLKGLGYYFMEDPCGND